MKGSAWDSVLQEWFKKQGGREAQHERESCANENTLTRNEKYWWVFWNMFFARNPCWPKIFPAGIDKTPLGSFAQNENPPWWLREGSHPFLIFYEIVSQGLIEVVNSFSYLYFFILTAYKQGRGLKSCRLDHPLYWKWKSTWMTKLLNALHCRRTTGIKGKSIWITQRTGTESSVPNENPPWWLNDSHQ